MLTFNGNLKVYVALEPCVSDQPSLSIRFGESCHILATYDNYGRQSGSVP